MHLSEPGLALLFTAHQARRVLLDRAGDWRNFTCHPRQLGSGKKCSRNLIKNPRVRSRIVDVNLLVWWLRSTQCRARSRVRIPPCSSELFARSANACLGGHRFEPGDRKDLFFRLFHFRLCPCVAGGPLSLSTKPDTSRPRKISGKLPARIIPAIPPYLSMPPKATAPAELKIFFFFAPQDAVKCCDIFIFNILVLDDRFQLRRRLPLRAGLVLGSW